MAITELNSNLPENRLARYAYFSGLAGMVLLPILAFFAAVNKAMDDGWWLFSMPVTSNKNGAVLFVLFLTAAVMFAIELAIRIRIEKKIINVSQKIKSKKYKGFLAECIVNYALNLAILYMALSFYRSVNEYGYSSNNLYYQPFFYLIDIVWSYYLMIGFPYVVITRALQYDVDSDRREAAYLLLKIIVKIFTHMNLVKLLKKYNLFDCAGDSNMETFGVSDRKILLALFVKMFFIPLMTVFFTDQFTHLVNNWGYIVSLLIGINRDSRFSLLDLYNISFTVIFAIDVGLAWCGYTLSTRWIKNACVSAEPTLLGWIVAVLCYPPFQHLLGIYITIPSEKGFLSIPHQWFVAILAVISVMSYLVYMSATVVFGLRFSNLTHRGIIRTGAYAIIRHPAYTAKNISWWCVMMPLVIYQAVSNNTAAVLIQIIGLAGMSGLYYFRAITEERHLSIDPEYQDYCRQVPYRFIPGIM